MIEEIYLKPEYDFSKSFYKKAKVKKIFVLILAKD